MLSVDERKSLMAKPNLSAKEIALLEDCCESKARRIMKMCKLAFKGDVPGNIHKVTTISYLRYSGADESYLTRLLKGSVDDKTYIS